MQPVLGKDLEDKGLGHHPLSPLLPHLGSMVQYPEMSSKWDQLLLTLLPMQKPMASAQQAQIQSADTQWGNKPTCRRC